MRRSMALLAVLFAMPFAAPAAAAFAAEACTSASAATYRHSFDGAAGRATITAVRPLCAGQTQSFALISYTAGTGSGQFVYATARDTIKATDRSVTLTVTVPPCYAQVDAIIGTGLLTEVTDTGNPYGDKTLGATGSRSAGGPAHYRGGSTECAPAPRVTFTSACDGSYTATLANGENANVGATFLIGGRLTRLGAGRSTTVPGPTGGTLTIRASSFTTYVGGWRAPATGCTSAAPGTTTTAPAAVLVPSQSPAAALPPAAPPSAGAALPTTDAPVAVFGTPATTTAAAAPARSRGGMSTGSMIAIGFGILLIGGGGILLTRVIRTLREPG